MFTIDSWARFPSHRASADEIADVFDALPKLGAADPRHLVETRLRHLLASGSVQSVVMAPIPWVPLSHQGFGHYRAFARTPRQERLRGIEVLHPRYPLLPKVGMSTAPFLLAAACARSLHKVLERGYEFDAIDAHYFYPAGVAAVLLGRHFASPW